MNYATLPCLFMFSLMLNTDESTKQANRAKIKQAKINGMGPTSTIEQAKEGEPCSYCCFFSHAWPQGLDVKAGTVAFCYDDVDIVRLMSNAAHLCAEYGVKTKQSTCKGYGIWKSKVTNLGIASHGVGVQS